MTALCYNLFVTKELYQILSRCQRGKQGGKLKPNSTEKCLIIIAGLFVALAVGFFAGRNLGVRDVTVSTGTKIDISEEAEDDSEAQSVDPETADRSSQSNQTEPQNTEEVSSEQQNEQVETSEPPEQEQRININTATAEELQTLTGIGPVISQRILDFRAENGAFQSVEELTKVSGIGEKMLEKIYDNITVG